MYLIVNNTSHLTFNDKDVDRFLDIFCGCRRCYGVFDPKAPQHKQYRTVKSLPGGPDILTRDVVRTHLLGECSIGANPFDHGPDDDETHYTHARWACIDIDYPQSTDQGYKWATSIQEVLKIAGGGSYIEKSKGKGWHVFVFFSEPVTAGKARQLCAVALQAAGIGHPCEIFPKQDEIAPDEEVWGNWVNLPYFGVAEDGPRTVEHPETAQAMALREFLDHVEGHRHTRTEVDGIVSALSGQGAASHAQTALYNANISPPTGVFAPVAQGERNTSMFRASARLHHAGIGKPDASVALSAVNAQYQPPLDKDELQGVIDNAYNSPTNAVQPPPIVVETAKAFIARTAGIKLSFYADPILLEGGSMVIFGPTGIGKSILALQMARDLAIDGQLFGFPTNRSGGVRVLYLDGENGERVIRDRLQALLALRTSPDVEDKLHIYSDLSGGLYFGRSGRNGPQDNLADIQHLLRELDIDVVFVDTLKAFCKATENDANEMREALDRLRAVCVDANAAVVVLHHANKSLDQRGLGSMRGSSVLGDWPETVAQLSRYGTRDMVMTFCKTRNGVPPDPLKLTWGPSHIGLSVTTHTQRTISNQDVVDAYNAIAAATGKKKVRQPDVIIKLGTAFSVDKKTIYKAIQHATTAKAIQRKKKGTTYELWV